MRSVAERLNHQRASKTTETPNVFMKNMIINPGKVFNTNSSKRDYIDPRIIVAWCKKNGVPLQLVLSEGLIEKFRWALSMADENFVFCKENSLSH